MQNKPLLVLTASFLVQGCLADAQDATSSEDGTATTVGALTPTCVDPIGAIHVAVDGNDKASGSDVAPFKTIKKALERAQAGANVVVHAGTYNELVTFPRSGAPGKPITLRARCGDRPVIAGTGKGGSDAQPALVTIANQAYVAVEGFRLTKLTGSSGNFPAGIWVRGTARDVTIRNNVIDLIRAESDDEGAHGIAVYGTSTTPIENVLIEGNELKDLVLHSSEALVLNGNVRKFVVRGNEVHHVDNIAFDFIGYERTCKACVGDDLSSAAVDRVRDGLVVGNSAHDVTSRGNPAYGNDRSAGCFYVDGGGRITIERNVAHHCDIGIELASEHFGKATSEVIVRNNFLWGHWVTGIATGGYNSGKGAGGGSAERCSIVHNTIVDSSKDSWAKTGLLLQSRNVDGVYVNNIIVATAGSQAFTVAGKHNTGNRVDHNLYANGRVVGVAAGVGSITLAPRFVAPADGDLHLLGGSPGIGAGAVLGAAVAGEVDIDGAPRGTDMGADQRTL